jgi:phosphoglycolate phosphatase
MSELSKDLYIFDMDGTLINSSITIANAINFVRKKIDLEPMDVNHIIKKINDQTIHPARYFYGLNEFESRHESWFQEYYSKNHKQELVLYDGVKNLLIDLKEKGALLAIATNAYKASAIESLRFLKIYDIFDSIACYDEVKMGKPHPDMLYKILDELDISNNNSIFIGDGNRDKIAAQRADIDYIMVNWGFSNHQEAISSVDKLSHKLIYG